MKVIIVDRIKIYDIEESIYNEIIDTIESIDLDGNDEELIGEFDFTIDPDHHLEISVSGKVSLSIVTTRETFFDPQEVDVISGSCIGLQLCCVYDGEVVEFIYNNITETDLKTKIEERIEKWER